MTAVIAVMPRTQNALSGSIMPPSGASDAIQDNSLLGP